MGQSDYMPPAALRHLDVQYMVIRQFGTRKGQLRSFSLKRIMNCRYQ